MQSQPHEYDNTLKALFGDEAAEILPHLLPGAEVISEQNIEIDRSKLRADLVYNIIYRGLPHILNMELQTSADSKMGIRLLLYHVGLLARHGKPVISVALYPFEASIQQPPFEELSGEEVLLRMHYIVLSLWKMEAEPFVRNHVVGLYTLLPAMKGVHALMLIQAIKEMEQRYPREQLRHHLVRFQRILQRSKTISQADRQRVEEELHMQYGYDWFIDDNPEVIERVAKGEIKGIQRSVIALVKRRFPRLEELAKQRVAQISDSSELENLIGLLSTIRSEKKARQILSTPTA
jgi:hypothetical protein